MDPADTKELPREMSAADVAEETKADVEAVKSVEDASYPTTASRELSHTKPSFAADADRGPGERAFYAFGIYVRTDGSRRACGVGACARLVATLGAPRETSAPQIDRVHHSNRR